MYIVGAAAGDVARAAADDAVPVEILATARGGEAVDAQARACIGSNVRRWAVAIEEAIGTNEAHEHEQQHKDQTAVTRLRGQRRHDQ